MNLKQNINKIHVELDNRFDEVKLVEKSNIELGNYFELECVNENKKLIALITKKSLDSDNFNWKYFSNPDKKDFLVERVSNVETFLNDVEDIFEKKRFDSDYIK